MSYRNAVCCFILKVQDTTFHIYVFYLFSSDLALWFDDRDLVSQFARGSGIFLLTLFDDFFPLLAHGSMSRELIAGESFLSGSVVYFIGCFVPVLAPHCVNYYSLYNKLLQVLILQEEVLALPRDLSFRINFLEKKPPPPPHLNFGWDCFESIISLVRIDIFQY